jgi:hypothetical protein
VTRGAVCHHNFVAALGGLAVSPQIGLITMPIRMITMAI